MSTTDSTSLSATSLARYGCYVGLACGAALIVAGFYAMAQTEAPPAFQIALLLTGVLEALACVKALRKNRAAWSLATALNGTLAFAFFFGTGPLSDALQINLLLGFVPCIVFLVATILLSLGSDEY